MYQKPKSAKKLFFDVIPKNIDDYYSHLNKYYQGEDIQYDNPIWHIHKGNPPKPESEITFNSLMNLVSICNTVESKIIWKFVNEYDKSLNSKDHPNFDKLINCAINYYIDFVLPNKKYIKIDTSNKLIFEDILNFLSQINNDLTAEEIQTQIYEIGKKHNFTNLRDFFKLIYQVLLGQDQGPRLGSFFRLYGIKKIIKLIDDSLNNL